MLWYMVPSPRPILLNNLRDEGSGDVLIGQGVPRMCGAVQRRMTQKYSESESTLDFTVPEPAFF